MKPGKAFEIFVKRLLVCVGFSEVISDGLYIFDAAPGQMIVLCEQVRVIDKTRIKKRLGEVRNLKKIEDINQKILVSFGIKVAE